MRTTPRVLRAALDEQCRREVLWREQHDAGFNTRVEHLRRGQRFLAADGRYWTYERPDGALSGVFHCVRDDGHRDCFAGCADVVIACSLCGALEGESTDTDCGDGLRRCRACLGH